MDYGMESVKRKQSWRKRSLLDWRFGENREMCCNNLQKIEQRKNRCIAVNSA